MKKIIVFIFCFNSVLLTRADEGMWIPLLLEQLNQSDMQSMGLKLTAEDIYSISKSSLKDAVCLFGGGCTAEVVSDQGMIFTNYHCGKSAIQSHSSLDNNYLESGYWATDLKDELSNPGLSVTFLVRMEEVTNKVLDGILPTMSESQRDDATTKNIKLLETEAIKGAHYKAKIKPFYYGNKYYLFIYEVFTDIRLVGAPPNSIGGFGGDTDNWEWPRHTGDFTVFRIYANKNNEPADYSENNVPYKSKRSLTISLKGIKEGDFTMVYGYPGRTQEYLTSYGVNLIGNIEDPVMVNIREKKLEILNDAMKRSPLIKIQYAAKYAGIANYWKKWSGESKGLKKCNAVEKKKEQEKDFMNWANADNTRKAKYGNLISAFEKVYSAYTPVALAYDHFSETGSSLEMIKYAWSFNNLLTKCLDTSVKDEEIIKLISQYKAGVKGFFKNYDQPTDKKIFITSLKLYYSNADETYKPEIFNSEIKNKFNGDIEKYADYLFNRSCLVSEEKVTKMLSGIKRSRTKKITDDPFFKLARSVYSNYQNNILPLYAGFNNLLDSLQRVYIIGLREMLPEKKFYTDANLTLRLAYGKVAGYKPRDAVDYIYYTTLDGMMQKEDSTIDDYKIPQKLKELYSKKDYGRYASDGKMHIAFIATNHTTGGNSGSPVLNAEGQLIGINFDRVWEGTMNDIMFNTEQCRNISLDIRYVLFIIDKYAGAKRLIDEMKIVE